MCRLNLVRILLLNLRLMGNASGNCCSKAANKDDEHTTGNSRLKTSEVQYALTEKRPKEFILPVHMRIVEPKQVKGLRMQSLRSYAFCELLDWLIGFGRPELPIREPTDPYTRQPLAFPSVAGHQVHFLIDAGQQNARDAIRFIGECLPNSRTPCGDGIAFFPQHMTVVLGKWNPATKKPDIVAEFKIERTDSAFQVVTWQKLRMTDAGMQLELVSQETTQIIAPQTV